MYLTRYFHRKIVLVYCYQIVQHVMVGGNVWLEQNEANIIYIQGSSHFLIFCSKLFPPVSKKRACSFITFQFHVPPFSDMSACLLYKSYLPACLFCHARLIYYTVKDQNYPFLPTHSFQSARQYFLKIFIACLFIPVNSFI